MKHIKRYMRIFLRTKYTDIISQRAVFVYSKHKK